MPTLEPRHDAFVAALERALPPVTVLVPELHLLGAGAEEEGLAVLFAQLLPRGVDIEVEGVCDRFQEAVEVHAPRARPRDDRTVCDAARPVGHHELRIDLVAGPETVTSGACPIRGVEREVARSGLVEGDPAMGASEMLREGDELLLAVISNDAYLGDPLGEPQCGLHGLGETLANPVAAHEAVDDHL